MKMAVLSVLALTACGSTDDHSRSSAPTTSRIYNAASIHKSGQNSENQHKAINELPQQYVKAFACRFDENPKAASKRYHETPAGRAQRASDLSVLRSLGFSREGRNGDLESLGGKINAPRDLKVFGLPVDSVEINGLIGDVNSMFVTTFAKTVTVDQVVKAARLDLDLTSFKKYKMKHYSRRVGDDPYTELYLDDRNGKNAVLVCQIQATPD